LKVATGTKERNGPQRAGQGADAGLKLVTRPNPSQKIYKIGICENVFSPRREAIVATSRVGEAEVDIMRSDPGRDTASGSGNASTAVACAAFGLVLGYIVGRLGR
jgi:hypothetical protein